MGGMANRSAAMLSNRQHAGSRCVLATCALATYRMAIMDDTDRVVLNDMNSLETEYPLLNAGPCLVDRSDRSLLEITGQDRIDWLHNLTTNQGRTLSTGDGNYAFVLNSQGRILFDLNVVVRPDCIWVDVDRRFLDVAKGHFEKFRIIEDVRVEDRGDAFCRLALIGRECTNGLSNLGAAHVVKMPQLGLTELNWQDATIPVMRHDFCGPFAVELFVPKDVATAYREFLSDSSGPIAAKEVSMGVVQVRRIEAGIPGSGSEICDEYLPAETGQLERAVSFNKGCYLGQEVVERMRSRGVQSRCLVGLKFESDRLPDQRCALLLDDGKTAGMVTSVCRSISLGCPIGFGYVRTAQSSAGSCLQVISQGERVGAVVVDLPFVHNSNVCGGSTPSA